MHSEYAVEPTMMGADWETFRYLIEMFGLDKGRVISRLPKRWEKKVIQAGKEAGIPEIRLASMVERLRSNNPVRIVDFGREYIADNTWIENSIREHAARPFRAIICSGDEKPCAEALGLDDCNDDAALFKAPISCDIVRTADQISDALFLSAVAAHEIDIVDPFFDVRPGQGDFLSPLAALLGKLAAFGVTGKLVRIHFRTHDSRPPDNILLQDVPQRTNGIIPNGFVLQLNEWEEIQGGEDFHDRFFLTDTGGLMIGAGMSAAGATETATFTLLDGTHAQSLRSRFAVGATVYTKVGRTVQVDSNGSAKFV